MAVAAVSLDSIEEWSKAQVPGPRLAWNRDPAWNPNLPRDEGSVLSYTGAAVYPNSSSLGGWVYQSGPMSVLELDKEGGSLLPSTLGSLNPLRPILGPPDVRFGWSEVEKVEAIRSVLPWPAGVRFWLRGRDGFFLSLGLLRPKVVYKVLDFAESKGAAVCREPVFTWTGRAKAKC